MEKDSKVQTVVDLDVRSSDRTDSIEHDNKLESINTRKDIELLIDEDIEESPIKYKSRGVILIESVKELMYQPGKQHFKYAVYGLLLLLSWAAALDKSTTRNYEVVATSEYKKHTFISTLSIANSIISAVSDLFFAKFADLTSRPTVYFIAVFFFVVGYIIVPAGNTISSFIVGNVFGSLGASSLGTVNIFLVGDLTPMKWRGFGIAFLGAPFLVLPWISGFIVESMIAKSWRWGYGMFTIILPCTVLPCAFALIYIQRKAKQSGIVAKNAAKYGIKTNYSSKAWVGKIYKFSVEMDLLGLLVLGTSLALILLPMSLYESADNGFRNPSMIAMFVVGGVLLFSFAYYEICVAPFPCLHKSNFNRTIITEIIFNLVYFMASQIRGTYLSSFTWIYTDWNDRDWTYYNNIGLVSKTIFGISAGILHRVTHRYKYVQILGICIELVGAGLWIMIKGRGTNVAVLIIAELLSGIGGGFAIYSSRTAVQIAVPHQNMTMAISTLFLFASVGKAIGSTVAAGIWNSKMPNNLRSYMPSSIDDEQVDEFFGNLRSIKKYDIDDPIRIAAIEAYVDTYYYLWTSSLGITFICLIVCFFQKNYYLGDGQNAVDPEEKQDALGRDKAPDFFKRTGSKIPYIKKYCKA